MRRAGLAALAVAAVGPGWADERDMLVGSWRCITPDAPPIVEGSVQESGLQFASDGGLVVTSESRMGADISQSRTDGTWELRMPLVRMDLGARVTTRTVSGGRELSAAELKADDEALKQWFGPTVVSAEISELSAVRMSIRMGRLDMVCERGQAGIS